MKLVIFATFDEAKASIEKTNAQIIDKDCYQYANGNIVLSGIGSYAAQMAVSKYGNHASEIINMGFAASLQSHYIGQVCSCAIVSKYTPLLEKLDPISVQFMERAIPLKRVSESGYKLISSDFPVHSERQREGLRNWDLLDMEGYGIAFAAHYLGKRCQLIKVISDFAKTNGRLSINKHKEQLSEILSEVVL